MEVLSNLGINFAGLVWGTLNYLFLVFLLSRLLYKPIVRTLGERQQRVSESVALAERVRREADEAAQERESHLADTRRQIQEMLAQATQTAGRIQSDARERAQQEAQRIVERAQQEVEAERAQSMAELRREVANLAVMAAERIISRSLDDQYHRQLVDDFLAEQSGDGKEG